jgi:hypothetical protein
VGEFADVPDDLRAFLPEELMDMGGGKAAMPIDEEMVKACRNARDYSSEIMEKALALARNIKDNGADFAETWAALMALSKKLDQFGPEQAPILLAYLVAEQVFVE